MKSKLLTFFLLLIISIQILPVIELTQYCMKMTQQKLTLEKELEPKEDHSEEETFSKKIELGFQQMFFKFETNDSKQQYLLIIHSQAIHQFFATIPTRPPLIG